MAKLVRSGDSSGIDVDFGIKTDCINQSPLNSSVQQPGPTSSFREIGEGLDDKTVPKWETGSASSRDKEGSILDYLNPISSNMSFTVKHSFDILQSMGQAIHVSDDKDKLKDPGVFYCRNRAAEDLYGYSASEAIGRDVLHLIAEEQVYKDGKKIVDRSAMRESWTGLFPPFYETPTTFTSRRNPSREAAYPSSSQLSKSGPPATAAGLNSQQKSFPSYNCFQAVYPDIKND
ncbi:hypothetical protein MKX03_007699 [Papaver bracteatum]|nr:hypothetical protein MKX03_007699 [Papaver bracteatum]